MFIPYSYPVLSQVVSCPILAKFPVQEADPKADIRSKDGDGETALDRAARNVGHKDVVALMQGEGG